MNLTPLALAAAYAYLNRSDKEKGDKEAPTPAATPTIAPAAAPVAQTTNAADMLSANNALNAGMNDYDTTGNIGKPMPMVKPPNRKPSASSSEVKKTTTPTKTSVKQPTQKEIAITQATEDMEAGKKLAAPEESPYLTDPISGKLTRIRRDNSKSGLTRAAAAAADVLASPINAVREQFGSKVDSYTPFYDKYVRSKETPVANKKGGSIKAYAKGGTVSASKRGDGIAQRGHTKGRLV